MTLQQLKYVCMVAETGKITEAAKKLYISQPSLTNAIHELEKEMNVVIFNRTNKGISLSAEGEIFLGYARQVLEQAAVLEDKYKGEHGEKKKFCVSTQHYSFAVNAFVHMVKQYGMDEYEFAVHETKTHEVIEDVKNGKSEIGILYINSFNKNVLEKIFNDNYLEFHKLLECEIYVYMYKGHPLAGKKLIKLEELKDYPCLSFDQGDYNSFYYAEEVLSTYEYKQLIKANDRATMLNLMVGLNGYTLCSGIICEELNGDEYCAVKLDAKEVMDIGYISRKGIALSTIGQQYLEEISKYKAL